MGCATCTTILVSSVATITCQTCVSNLQLQNSGSIKICGCTTNQFLRMTPTPVTCVSCPSACLTCTSLTSCTSCVVVGFYLSVNSCLACMPVCRTCSGPSTCLTCRSTATLVSNVCTCPVNTYFDINTRNCLSCLTLQPNCANCIYNGVYTASAPPPVVCSLANTGFYVNSTGSAVACVAYCTNCDNTPTPICNTCNTNFTFDGVSSCICTGGLYFSTAQNTCSDCGTVIPGCISCQNNTIPSATQCITCNPVGFFAASSPSLTCTACPPLCTSCTSLTVCTGCINNLAILSGMCGCDANITLYLDPLTQLCTLCSTAVFNCQTCNSGATGLTCATCINGTYPTAGNTSCLPCPAECTACSSPTVCSACEPGFSLSGNLCVCSTNCL